MTLKPACSLILAGLLCFAACKSESKTESKGEPASEKETSSAQLNPDKKATDTMAGDTAAKDTMAKDGMPEPGMDKGMAKEAMNPNIVGEEVTYQAGDTALKGYIAYDKTITKKRPGILVVHEWWGHNEYSRKRARMLAELGYTALAVDMYGEGKQASHPEDAQKFSGEVMSNMPDAVKRFEAAQQLLEKHSTVDSEKVSAVGYCFGGAVVLQMARNGLDLDGVASFHGNLMTAKPAEKGKLKAKVLVLTGAADPFIPAEQVQGFQKEMTAAGADLKLVEYPGVKHSFTNPDADKFGEQFKLPLAYDKEADEKSWAELKTFLGELYPAG